MYYILYCRTKEMICNDIDQVMDKVIAGWKLYGYADNKLLAESLLRECKHY